MEGHNRQRTSTTSANRTVRGFSVFTISCEDELLSSALKAYEFYTAHGASCLSCT